MLERKHIGKIDAIPAAVSQDFSNAFAPNRLRQMAVSNLGCRVQSPSHASALRRNLALSVRGLGAAPKMFFCE